MRLGFAMLLALGLALTLLSGAYGVDDKEVTIKGQVICAKCGLNVEKKCATVAAEKKDGKDVLYYFDAESNKKFPHKDYCQEAKDASITGVVSEKDGKKWIAVTKIDLKK
jgi:hypothetical protein